MILLTNHRIKSDEILQSGDQTQQRLKISLNFIFDLLGIIVKKNPGMILHNIGHRSETRERDIYIERRREIIEKEIKIKQ